MSIPPLVCSTPPPPEICVDDKDPDDFDLQYNLSQEDFNERYDNELSSYTFESIPKPANNEPVPEICQNEVNISFPNDKKDTIEFVTSNDILSNIIFKNHEHVISKDGENTEEDCNIEDLDLKLNDSIEIMEVSKDIKNSISEDQVVSVETKNSSDFLEKSEGIETEMDSANITTIQDNFGLDQIKGTHVIIKSESKDTSNKEEISKDAPDTYEDTFTGDFVADNIVDEIKSTNFSLKDIESLNEAEDQFGEFEDFQFQPCKNEPVTIVDNSENPWDSQQADNNDFGNFCACFDQLDSNSNQIQENENLEPQMNNSNMVDSQNQSTSQCDDDDFDDFNEFKSSSEQSELSASNEKDTQMPVFSVNLSDNEAQLYERINKVITEIFPNEISEPVSEIERHLDGLLEETWGHLLETDVRQSYRVNWNNSIGQITLLKSLSIDSRNILFGPKWNNMPKYAPNMTSALLQPQKQSNVSSVLHSDTIEVEKATAKPSTVWSDPSDLQEPCKTDNRSLSTVPKDLDVFEASSSSNEVYSSTLNVLPLRQINLPDTHIFTPSDSETPRSKTIHYDTNPTILLPHPAVDTSQSRTDLTPTERSQNEKTNIKAEGNKYWEFQDFKCAPTGHVKNNEEEKNGSPPIVTLPAQVLLPIKAEPSVPVLNWPDPGDVKESFDDLTDFISSTTSWTSEKSDKVMATPIDSQHITSTPAAAPPVSLNSENIVHNVESVIDDSHILKDDFDAFQSAIPFEESINPSYQNKLVNSAGVSEITNRIASVLTSSTLSSNTMQNNMIMEKSIVTQPSVPPTITNILQPTPASSQSSNYNQQKYGQILQPLSLENYSQINWPSPGIDLQDLSRFNPVETLQSLKSDLSVNNLNKGKSPEHSHKTVNQASDDDWGDFVSSKPTPQTLPKKSPSFGDDDEWTDFISSPSVKSQNGLNTISLNVHTSLNNQKSSYMSKLRQNNSMSVDIPTLNYITPKSSSSKSYDKQFQNL